jgi:dihydroorotate dehydrogenase
MYKTIIRPILFLIDPEKVHKLIVFFIKTGFAIPGISKLFKKLYTVDHPKLKRNVFGLRFNNPVGLAAGFDKNAEFFNEFSNFGFSFIEIGTVTPKGQPGNPKPRLFRLPEDKALINRMGFNNYGAKVAAKNLKNRKTDIIIGGNLGKNTNTPNEMAAEDYRVTFNELYYLVDYFVVNVSCPNVTDLHKLQDRDSLLLILNALMEERKNKTKLKPILLKISPDLNQSQIDEIIDIAHEIQLDGFVVANTSTTRENLLTDNEKVTSFANGGLSGKPLKDRSNELIRYIATKTNRYFPIIGVGGIMTPEDAIEKLEAGAALVQIYTGFIYEGPGIVKKINKAILNKMN